MKRGMLQVLREYLPKIKEEEERLDRKYAIRGQIIHIGDYPVDRMLEQNIHFFNLQRELLTYSLEELITFQAVMYFGRDIDPGEGAFKKTLESQKSRNEDKKEIVKTILEKTAVLERYIKDATWKLDSEGINIEDLFIVK